MVLIEGRLQTRSWTDKAGAQRKTTEIVCERMQLGPRPQGAGGGRPQGKAPAEPAAEKAADSTSSPQEEIPTVSLDEEEGETKAEDLPF